MDLDDKVCEQVSLTMLNEVYPKEVIERCVHQSQPWSTKKRRVRASTALALVLFVIGMARCEPSQPMPGVAKLGRQAKGPCLWGLGSRGVGAPEKASPPGRWLGAGLGGPDSSWVGALSGVWGHVGAHHLLPRDR